MHFAAQITIRPAHVARIGMLDCTAMNALHLHIKHANQANLPLPIGLLSLGRNLAPVPADGPWLLQLCNDRRGVWMAVADGVSGIHVNGRPVHKLAMLRAGDTIHAEGHELLLQSVNDAPKPTEHADPTALPHDAACPRMLLRAVGGAHHGRSFSLETPCLVGRTASARLRLDDPAIADLHALVEIADGQAILHRTASDVQLNGRPVRSAVLKSGDQLCFGPRHHFVVEGSLSGTPQPATAIHHRTLATPSTPAAPPRNGIQRASWLLLAALLLAGSLAALLMFGAG